MLYKIFCIVSKLTYIAKSTTLIFPPSEHRSALRKITKPGQYVDQCILKVLSRCTKER